MVESDWPEDTFCPYSGHCSQEKVRHLSPVSALGSVRGFIMSLWTWSQKYVSHWLGRSEEVSWLCLEQSGPGRDPHGLMTENPVRISLSQWLTFCTTSHPLQNLNSIGKNLPLLISGERVKENRSWQIFLASGGVHDYTWLSHCHPVGASHSNSQPCHQEKITFWA